MYLPICTYLPTYVPRYWKIAWMYLLERLFCIFLKTAKSFVARKKENDTDTCYRFPPKKFYNINYYKMIRGMIKRVFWWKEGGSMPPHYRFLNWQKALGIL